MKTDSLFYRLFQELPGCYFEAIGADAKEAERYAFCSEEIKQAGLRLDGVFVPTRADAPGRGSKTNGCGCQATTHLTGPLGLVGTVVVPFRNHWIDNPLRRRNWATRPQFTDTPSG